MADKSDKSETDKRVDQQKADQQSGREGRFGDAERSATPAQRGDDFATKLQAADPKNELREQQQAAQAEPFAGVPDGGGQRAGESGHPTVHYWLAEAETARLNGNEERRKVIVEELGKHGYEVE
jgi:hypothetical protein